MQIDYEKLLKYCYDNIGSLDLKDDECLKIYDTAIKYLMNTKIVKWTREDAVIVICFLTQKTLLDNNIDSEVRVNLYDDDKYMLNPTCYKNGICYINFNLSILKNIVGLPTIYGLQAIFKEISFVLLDKNIQDNNRFNKYTYIMAIESILRRLNPELYMKNINELYKESQSNIFGFDSALTFIKLYNEHLYNAILDTKHKDIIEHKKTYRKKFSDETFFLSLEPVNSFRNFDRLVSEYIKLYPDVIEVYPVLNIGFKKDGSKKDIVELIMDRSKMLMNGNKDEVDALYYAVCNYKDYDNMGTKDECDKIINYIMETYDTDDFVIDLLRHRLEFTGENESKIEEFIQSIKSRAMLKKLQKLKESY